MLVTCVTVWVKKENINDFINATMENHKSSVKEPGNRRFDVLQCADDPTRFLIYEAYEYETATASHKETPHYKKWRRTVADWMAKPREGVQYKVIAPTDAGKW